MSAVDLEHLRQFTAGDVELEIEVLGLFVENGALYLATIMAGDADNAWHTAAHSLKGSARSIGAHAVAAAAEKVEHSANHNPVPIEVDIAPLEIAFKDAEKFIKQYIMSNT